jgi:hypothetical protein
VDFHSRRCALTTSSTPAADDMASVAGADPALVERLRAEYVEMPGMSLTLDQVVRLCGIERAACQRVLAALVNAQFLALTADGVYTRRSADSSHRRMAKAAADVAAPRLIGRAS